MQDEALALKDEFMKQGKGVDAFVTSSINKDVVEKVRYDLEDIIRQAGSPGSRKKMDGILNEMCAQDMHEVGMIVCFCTICILLMHPR